METEKINNNISNNEESQTEKLNYIYLIKVREFIRTNEEVFKVGKTTQENLNRFGTYPRGSRILFLRVCVNCHIIEKEVIEIMKTKYIHKKEYGNEYFEGDFKKMINDINKVIDKYYALEDENNEDTPVNFEIKDDEVNNLDTHDFKDKIKEQKKQLNEKNIPSLLSIFNKKYEITENSNDVIVCSEIYKMFYDKKEITAELLNNGVKKGKSKKKENRDKECFYGIKKKEEL